MLTVCFWWLGRGGGKSFFSTVAQVVSLSFPSVCIPPAWKGRKEEEVPSPFFVSCPALASWLRGVLITVMGKSFTPKKMSETPLFLLPLSSSSLIFATFAAS